MFWMKKIDNPGEEEEELVILFEIAHARAEQQAPPYDKSKAYYWIVVMTNNREVVKRIWESSCSLKAAKAIEQ